MNFALKSHTCSEYTYILPSQAFDSISCMNTIGIVKISTIVKILKAQNVNLSVAIIN